MTGSTTTEAPRPVTDEENKQVNGFAKVSKRIFDKEMSEVAKLRQRHEAYHESLPREPVEALNEIKRLLNDVGDLFEQPFAARAALEILYELAIHDALGDLSKPIIWLTDQGLAGMKVIEESCERSHDIADQFHPRHEAFRV